MTATVKGVDRFAGNRAAPDRFERPPPPADLFKEVAEAG
jgi:hypothetical protein